MKIRTAVYLVIIVMAFLLFPLCFCRGATPAPRPSPTPATADTPISFDDITATVQHQIALAHDTAVRSDAVDAANKDLNGHLTESNATLNDVLKKSDELQSKIDALKEELAAQKARAEAESRRADSEAAHRKTAEAERDVFVWILAALGAAFALYAVLPWASKIGGWLGPAIAIATPLLVFGVVVIVVRSTLHLIVT